MQLSLQAISQPPSSLGLIPLDSGVTSGVLGTDALWGQLHSDTGSYVPLMHFSLCLASYRAGMILLIRRLSPPTF